MFGNKNRAQTSHRWLVFVCFFQCAKCKLFPTACSGAISFPDTPVVKHPKTTGGSGYEIGTMSRKRGGGSAYRELLFGQISSSGNLISPPFVFWAVYDRSI